MILDSRRGCKDLHPDDNTVDVVSQFRNIGAQVLLIEVKFELHNRNGFNSYFHLTVQNYCFKLLKLVSLKKKNKKNTLFFGKSAFFLFSGRPLGYGTRRWRYWLWAIGYGCYAIDLLTVHIVCLLSFLAENLD